MISPVSNSANAVALQAASGFGATGAQLKSLPGQQQVKAAAGQFESILLRQFIQESVGKIMGGAESGAAGGVYGYMLTDVLAAKLSEGGGLGLGRVIEQQLTPRQSLNSDEADSASSTK